MGRLAIPAFSALLIIGCGSTKPSETDGSVSSIDGGGDVVDAAGADANTTDAASCGTGFTCLPAAPTNWMGPVMVYEGAGADPAPTCPSPWPTEKQTLNGGLQPQGTCDCKCAAATGMSCGSAKVFDYGTTPLSCVQFMMTPKFTISSGQCTNVAWTSNHYAYVNNPNTTGGSCAKSLENNLATPTWDTRVRACGNDTLTQGGCQADNVCAPVGDAQFDRVCIYTEGDNACPVNSPYNQRVLYHGNFSDTRDCMNDCNCGTPSGKCNPRITFFDSCSNPQFGWGSVEPSNNCNKIVNPTSTSAVSYSAQPEGTCTASGGTITGAATPNTPSTYCCLP
jgi:hypothetical protein